MSATLSPVQRPASAFVVGKIQACHLKRLAIVYVRQSTLQQVERHQESTRLQYALTERALDLGWPPEYIEVIDDDLGRSGASAAGRPGFQRLVSEVSLDHVGLVLGIERSRLARSSRDWYQLLEVCALFSTLIGDADGLYDPQTYNDRLLLGLRGTMSEAELHILKQHMLEGKRAKARRFTQLLLTCPFTDEQVVVEEPEDSDFDLRVSARLPQTGQLLRWLLGAGDNLEVVAPEAFRHMVAEQARKMAAL